MWNLLLTRPYNDGGSEHSGRVAKQGSEEYYDVSHQRTATRLLSGSISDSFLVAEPGPASWAVEIAMAHNEVNALRVDPRPHVRFVLQAAFVMGLAYGHMRVAVIVTN